MSLFKIREFWTTTSEDDEYFDQNSLVVSKLNTDSDFIITGSQSGVLRIFKPSCELNEENSGLSSFNPNDVILEKIFDDPILQVGYGKFILASQLVQIAVLHPMLLAVYNLKSKEGIAEHGTQYILEQIYFHKLKRAASNFVIGPFGGTQNRDFICVQSLDGVLTFYEQETETFCCNLVEFLLPSAIEYVKKTDSFVTCTSDWCIASYRYKALSESGESLEEKIYSTPKLTYDWSYNLGEPIIDINSIEDIINKTTSLAILGERNLFCLTENGRLKFMKRLEYSPICFTCYLLDDKIISLIISETNTLLIYQNTTLKWSANIHFLPISISRIFLKTVKGALVILSEEGRLECAYLGTEPCLFAAPPLQSKDIDFEAAEKESEELNKIIKDAYGKDLKLENANSEKEFTVNVKVFEELETCTIENNIKEAFNNQMCRILIELNPQVTFEEVQVSLFVQRPLKVVPNSFFYSNLKDRTTAICHVFLDYEMEVSSLTLKIVTSVISSLGVPKTLTKYENLPLTLVKEVCQGSINEGTHKVTLNVDKNIPNLSDIFPEFINEDIFTSSSTYISFKNIANTCENQPVTIFPSKSSNRIRTQSNCLPSIAILVEQIIFRLKIHFSSENVIISCAPNILLTLGVSEIIKKHFEARQNVLKLQNDLLQLSSQFRVIQKRLISKLKVKNPTPLTNIEILMEDTYFQINETSQNLETELENLLKNQTELSCCLNLVCNIINCLQLNEELKNNLNSVFCVDIQDLETQGWEDVFDGSLCYLLRTKLALSDKDTMKTSHTSFEEIKDVAKVDKHLTQVFERIAKVSGSDNNNDTQETEENVKTNANNRNKETEDEKNMKPQGSQIAESSTRLLSARKSLLRRKKKEENVE